MPLTLHISVLYWYQFYINNPRGSRLANTIQQVCYCKCLVSQVELSVNMYKKFQQFKNRKTLCGKILPKIISALKLWNSVHIYLMCPYSKSIRQHQPGRAIIKKGMSLTCMTIIDPTKGWFGIVEVPFFYLDELARVNSEYIDKLSASVIQMFNQTWLFWYLCPCKVLFDNFSYFKQYFTLLLKHLSIMPICTSIKKPHINASV